MDWIQTNIIQTITEENQLVSLWTVSKMVPAMGPAMHLRDVFLQAWSKIFCFLLFVLQISKFPQISKSPDDTHTTFNEKRLHWASVVRALLLILQCCSSYWTKSLRDVFLQAWSKIFCFLFFLFNSSNSTAILEVGHGLQTPNEVFFH